MVEEFTSAPGFVAGEFLDLHHTSNSKIFSVPFDVEVRSDQHRARATIEIGALVSDTEGPVACQAAACLHGTAGKR